MGGHATPTSTGADAVPGSMLLAVRLHEAVFLAGALFAVYWVIVRPWRRDRRLGFDGMLLVALLVAWLFQDPLYNYQKVVFTYNAAFVNLGCPQCYLPGWLSFGRQLPEPLIWVGSWYIGFAVFVVILCCTLMRWFQTRWPRFGKLGPVLFLIAFGSAFDTVCELIWMRFGLYTWASAPKTGTLFFGRYYQLPLVELFLAGLWYAVPACLRYFKNDKGESWAERGISNVKVPEKQRTALRLLAVIGMVNLGFFLIYNIPFILISPHLDRIPKDIYTRSYLMDGFCGPGTEHACYDPRVPISTGKDSGFITPEGTFIAPKGLPVQTKEGNHTP